MAQNANVILDDKTPRFYLTGLGRAFAKHHVQKTLANGRLKLLGRKRWRQKHMNVDRRMYQIACSFPALRRKGAMQGDIPGIRPDGFYDIELHDYLYQGGGGALSSGEFLLLGTIRDGY
jgi:hypothetical protein